MIVKDLKVSYLCTNCENALKASNLNIELNINDIHKHANMAQCPNCKGIRTMNATHIECVLGTELVASYRYTLRCNICHARWVTNCAIGGGHKFMKVKKRIEAEALCANPYCDSRNFTLIAYQQVRSKDE